MLLSFRAPPPLSPSVSRAVPSPGSPRHELSLADVDGQPEEVPHLPTADVDPAYENQQQGHRASRAAAWPTGACRQIAQNEARNRHALAQVVPARAVQCEAHAGEPTPSSRRLPAPPPQPSAPEACQERSQTPAPLLPRQMEAERNLAIERENKILLGKMYSIMNAEPAYKTHKARPHRRRRMCMLHACAWHVRVHPRRSLSSAASRADSHRSRSPR